MADWELTFRTPTHASIKIEACQQLLASIHGTEATTTYGPVEGNPYDSYWGGITLETTSADGAIRVVISLAQQLSSVTDPTPHVRVDGVYIREVDPNRPDYAAKRHAWCVLRAGFAALGYADETGPSGLMIGDAEAAGDQETAAIVRALRRPVY